MTPLTGLGTPQVLAVKDSWVLLMDIPRFSDDWEIDACVSMEMEREGAGGKKEILVRIT